MPWVKGQSGNPGGRPAVTLEVRRIRTLCQEHSEEAYETILSVMRESDKDAARLAAALAVLKMAGVFSERDSTMTVNMVREPVQLPTAKLEEGLGPKDALQ